MRHFIFIIFSLTVLKSKAQSVLGSSIVNSLGKSEFYFIGQAHNNKANTILEKEILLALNNKYKVRYNLLEYAHSAAFLVNQYLETGQDSLLAFINSEAKFKFIKTIKAYNDTICNERKIRFYGVDFENRHEGRYTKKAIEIILEQLKLLANEPLYPLLRKAASSTPKDLAANLQRLKNYLAANSDKSRSLLGNFFIDLVLIANAQYDFTPKRDAAMIENFKRLHNELVRNGENPLFFGSFGTGHINPDNSKGIAIRLLNDKSSPVRNKVSIIGIQYFNCRFNKEGAVKSSEGNLNFLCKNAVVGTLASMEEDKETITFLTKEALSKLDCKKVIEQLSGLIIVRNFGAATFWAWE